MYDQAYEIWSVITGVSVYGGLYVCMGLFAHYIVNRVCDDLGAFPLRQEKAAATPVLTKETVDLKPTVELTNSEVAVVELTNSEVAVVELTNSEVAVHLGLNAILDEVGEPEPKKTSTRKRRTINDKTKATRKPRASSATRKPRASSST
jgi:hypothetical protein